VVEYTVLGTVTKKGGQRLINKYASADPSLWQERGVSYMGIVHIWRGGGRLCGDIVQIEISHIFSVHIFQ